MPHLALRPATLLEPRQVRASTSATARESISSLVPETPPRPRSHHAPALELQTSPTQPQPPHRTSRGSAPCAMLGDPGLDPGRLRQPGRRELDVARWDPPRRTPPS